MPHYDLAAYVRHARGCGSEKVFESAAGDLTIEELGCLAAQLRRLDPTWRLPHRIANALAVRLVHDGASPEMAARQTGLSRRTLRRVLREQPTTPIYEAHAR